MIWKYIVHKHDKSGQVLRGSCCWPLRIIQLLIWSVKQLKTVPITHQTNLLFQRVEMLTLFWPFFENNDNRHFLGHGLFSLKLIGSAMFGTTFNHGYTCRTTVFFGILKDDSL